MHVVVHAHRSGPEMIRIISARKANKAERARPNPYAKRVERSVTIMPGRRRSPF